MRSIALFTAVGLTMSLTSCQQPSTQPREKPETSTIVHAENDSIAICGSVNNSVLQTDGSNTINVCKSNELPARVEAKNGSIAIGGSVNGSTIKTN